MRVPGSSETAVNFQQTTCHLIPKTLCRHRNNRFSASYETIAVCPEHNSKPVARLCMLKLMEYPVRQRLKCDGTRAELRFRLSAKRTSPLTSAGVSVLSTTGSRVVRISGGTAGHTMFRGSVKGTGYPLHWPVSPHFPPVRHLVPSRFNWTLPQHYKQELRVGSVCSEDFFKFCTLLCKGHPCTGTEALYRPYGP